ncbi:DUF779 domain-containing protein [Curtobacterium sp. PhB190]|uniref:DUF779 domain-containing protein n=1 Tax=Curtobacterium sp. PhB190 TaxID=2485201 RepID=UPI00244388B2|nr:DUF779 domain-containing protein [Curtobacterium sp. PhB190]
MTPLPAHPRRTAPDNHRHHWTTPSAEYWKYTHLTIDVVDGRGGGFSVESPEGKRFLTRSRMFDDAELADLGLVPVAHRT